MIKLQIFATLFLWHNCMIIVHFCCYEVPPSCKGNFLGTTANLFLNTQILILYWDSYISCHPENRTGQWMFRTGQRSAELSASATPCLQCNRVLSESGGTVLICVVRHTARVCLHCWVTSNISLELGAQFCRLH